MEILGSLSILLVDKQKIREAEEKEMLRIQRARGINKPCLHYQTVLADHASEIQATWRYQYQKVLT